MTLDGVMTVNPRYLCGGWASCSYCEAYCHFQIRFDAVEAWTVDYMQFA